MHELDIFINTELQKEIEQLNKNEKKARNTEYDRLSNLVGSKKRTYKNIKNLSN